MAIWPIFVAANCCSRFGAMLCRVPVHTANAGKDAFKIVPTQQKPVEDGRQQGDNVQERRDREEAPWSDSLRIGASAQRAQSLGLP